MLSCKKRQEGINISGFFTISSSSYSLTSASVIHEGYADTDSTQFLLHATFSGYQGSIHLFLLAPDNDFRTAITYDRISTDTASHRLPRYHPHHLRLPDRRFC